MSGEPKMFLIYPDERVPEPVKEINFADRGIKEREHIQEWIASNPGIVGDDLLIVGKEFGDFDLTRERLDLLAVDADGRLVIIELKRDDTGSDVHWQAIKYASYVGKASADDIRRIYAEYANIDEQEAEQQLLEHLDSNDLAVLNNGQRIIIVSHRFAPEVTSAVLWLNEQSHVDDLITCVQLTPYQESAQSQMFLQSTTILPLPGADKYTIQVDSEGKAGISSRSPGRTSSFEKRNDEISRFCRGVKDELNDRVQSEDSLSGSYGFARGDANHRWFRMWPDRFLWGRHEAHYTLDFQRHSDQTTVTVGFLIPKNYLREQLGYNDTQLTQLATTLRSSQGPANQVLRDTRGWLGLQSDVSVNSIDDGLVQAVAGTIELLINGGARSFEEFDHGRDDTGD